MIIKDDEMGRAWSTNGEKRNARRILAEQPEGKRPLGRPRRRCVDNIKMYLIEIEWNGMDWIRPVEDSCEHGDGHSGSMKCWKVLE
jgi:hypothetical protein